MDGVSEDDGKCSSTSISDSQEIDFVTMGMFILVCSVLRDTLSLRAQLFLVTRHRSVGCTDDQSAPIKCFTNIFMFRLSRYLGRIGRV